MSKVKEKIEELAPQPMFADRENIKEAFNYATDVMKKSTRPEMEIYGLTAVAVIWNTLANKYKLTKIK